MNGKELSFSREYNAVFVDFDQWIKKGSKAFIRVYYEGNPKIAVNPPWDGGFSWKTDKNGKDWIGGFLSRI